MATIEGNEVALRNIASELIPPVRSGQRASASQDEVGPPFITRSITLASSYNVNDPNSVAPQWVYGLCVDNAPDGSAVYATFGNANPLMETVCLPGQVITLPRGSRRVFLRSDVDNNPVTVTWFLDRFAQKRFSPKPTSSVAQLVLGSFKPPLSAPVYSSAIDVAHASSLGVTFSLVNIAAPGVTCSLELSNAVPPAGQSLETGWVPPSASWFQAYSSGVPVIATITADGVLPLAIQPDGLMFRWARAKVDPLAAFPTGLCELDALVK